MLIEEIPVTECSKGEIIASDVTNVSGITLVAKDTVLNEYLVKKLIDLGIRNVHIYNSNAACLKDCSPSFRDFRKNYESIVLYTKKVLYDLAAGKPLDYKKVSSISSQIHNNLNENYSIIRCLAEVRSADEYTYTHCVHTSFYSMLIAKWLKMSDHEINKAIQAGLLHDIGKTKIPGQILCKGDILTKEEYEVIKKHTIWGYEMIEGMNEIDQEVKSVVLLHHERVDGSGYPLNKSADCLNVYSKIVAIADVFDAMTTDRVYKKRVTPFEAFEMFLTVGMGMFDLELLRVFLNNLSSYLVGASVLLNNGQTGEIVYVPLQNLTCPIIKVPSGYLDLSRENGLKILSMI